MADVAAIGFEASILGLKPAGGDVFPVKDAETALQTLKKIAAEYSVVILEESFLNENTEAFIREMNISHSVAILPVPLQGKTTGRTRKRIDDFVKKAIGISESVL